MQALYFEKEVDGLENAKEGDIYKVIEFHGQTFELKYGFYEEYERENVYAAPIPIYPDFLKAPAYTEDGHPFVTQMQELCEYGDSPFSDGCCVDCDHFVHGEDLIGICSCEERRI